jgi:hypothetical protein
MPWLPRTHGGDSDGMIVVARDAGKAKQERDEDGGEPRAFGKSCDKHNKHGNGGVNGPEAVEKSQSAEKRELRRRETGT